MRNYRSTPEIVGLANLVLRSPGGGRRSGSVVLEAQRETGPAPTLLHHPDDPSEAAAVAAQIGDLIAGRHGSGGDRRALPHQRAVRGRRVRPRRPGHPLPRQGGERFFQRKEVREAIVLIRGAARSDDGSVPLPDLVRDVLLGAGWSRDAPNAGGAARERWESLASLAALADDLVAADGEVRMPAFVRELDERMASQHAPSVQGVTLASLHAAKGLEWGTVFLIGALRRLPPDLDGRHPGGDRGGAAAALCRGDPSPRPPRRLVVGCTHPRSARDASPLALPRRNGQHPRRWRALAAQAFLSRRGAGATRTPKVARRSTCRTCGADLSSAAERTVGRCSTCPATYDEALFERLREWRLATSRAASVPAFVVFTDATLTAIAEQTPADVAGLSAISGVGQRKLDLYASQVLAVLGGEPPNPSSNLQQISQGESASATTESGA